MRQEYLVILFIRLGVVASLASLLVRFGRFKTMLLREDRTINQRLMLGLLLGSIFASGVTIRLFAPAYKAIDLGLEGSLVAGLLGGYVVGLLSGAIISIPAMFGHEWWTMPLLVGVGAMGGLIRDCAPDPEEIWRFSPFFDLSLYRIFARRGGHARAAFQLVFLLAIVFSEFLRQSIHHFTPRKLFAIYPDWDHPHPLSIVATYVATVFAVTLPLKIWNNARNEMKLEEQQRLLLQARMDALSRQINPHFLFNTLNSVSSLIRTNPQQARAVVYKLSNILRRLLRKHENFTALGEELDFINDYLSIEMIRFGEKLRFEKEVSPTRSTAWSPACCSSP